VSETPSPTNKKIESLNQWSKNKVVRLTISAITLLAALSILAYLVYRERDVLLSYEWQLRLPPIFLSFLLFSIDLALVAVVWGWIMNSLAKKLDYVRHFRYFTLSNIAKRIPGTVWYIASRAQLYRQDGIDLKLTSLASGIELGVAVMSSILTCLIFAIPIILQYNISPVVLGLLFVLLAFILHPKIIARIFRLFKVEAGAIQYKNIMQWILAYMGAWVLGGILLFAIGNAIAPISPRYIAYMIGSYSLVNLLATAVFFLPSNLGISEVGLSILLANIMPSSVAVIIAIFSRLLIIIYEFLWAALFIIIKPAENKPENLKEEQKKAY
jgi:hypothetical protein